MIRSFFAAQKFNSFVARKPVHRPHPVTESKGERYAEPLAAGIF